MEKPKFPSRPIEPKAPKLNEGGEIGCLLVGFTILGLFIFLILYTKMQIKDAGLIYTLIALFLLLILTWRMTIWDHKSLKESLKIIF